MCVYKEISFSHDKEILPFVTTWMRYAKRNQLDRERQILRGIAYTWNLFKRQTLREQESGYQRLGQGGRGG